MAEPGPPRLTVSVAEVRRYPGTRAEVHRAMEAKGLALSDARVVEGAELVLDGEVESISEGIVLTGIVTVPWEGECRRCLDPVSGRAEVAVREIYETHPTDGETWPMANDQIDVGPLLRDTALLALPLAPLCGDDCEGPVPETYPAVVGDDTPADEPDPDDQAAAHPVDPRWAALDDLDL